MTDVPGRPTLGTAERRLLLQCLDLRGHPPELRAASLDWDALLAVAHAAKVLPTLASRVLGAHLEFGEELRAALREGLEATAVHNALLLAELARTSRAFRAEGIEHVALKGAVLMARCYPSPALRHAVDLDVLVDPARFETAVATLRAAGYRDPEYTQALAFDGGSWARALNAPHLHAAAPLLAPSGVVLDLHRRVPTSDFEASGGFRGWRERAVPVQVHGVAVPTTGDHDLARHLCEHFALQNHGAPHDVPRLLCDLRALYPAGPPWVVLAAGSLRRRAALALVRALYEAAFCAAPSPSRQVRVLQRLAVADPSATRWLAELSALGGYVSRLAADLAHRPAFAAAKLLPAPSYMAAQLGAEPRTRRLRGQYARRLAAIVVPSARRG